MVTLLADRADNFYDQAAILSWPQMPDDDEAAMLLEHCRSPRPPED
jgi:hypothetical protein